MLLGGTTGGKRDRVSTRLLGSSTLLFPPLISEALLRGVIEMALTTVGATTVSAGGVILKKIVNRNVNVASDVGMSTLQTLAGNILLGPLHLVGTVLQNLTKYLCMGSQSA